MSTVSSATPSARAMRQMSNRNNLADLQLHKYVHQVRRQMTLRITDLDKDRLDVADFLTNLQHCDSDDLPQSKRVREEQESDDDQSNDSPIPRLHTQRNTHTAKTAPTPSSRRQRQERLNKEGDDRLSLDAHPLRRQTKNGGLTRREMLIRRCQEDERAKVSDFDKAELFLAKLREDDVEDRKDDFRHQATRKGFTNYLLSKIQGSRLPYRGGDQTEINDGWMGTRMVYPIRRLGNIAAKFKQGSGRNTPAVGDEPRGSFFSPRRKPTEERKDRAQRRSRHNSFYLMSQPSHPSLFEITEDDPPASALPRPACMPDIHRPRRDLVADLARAYGFGEAGQVTVAKPGGKISPSQENLPSSPSPQFNPLSRKSIAERRRLQRQAKVKLSVHLKARAKPPTDRQRESRGVDRVRALLRARLGAEGLDDRIREFMRDLDDLEDDDSSSSCLDSAEEDKGL